MNRRGKTLLELMLVITIVSSVLTMCGRTLTAMFRADKAQADALQRTARSTRLADLFRADAHAAVGAELVSAGKAGENAPEELHLSLPGERVIVYTPGERVTRAVREGNKRLAFDAWPLGPLSVRFELGDKGRQVTLVAENPDPFATTLPPLPPANGNHRGSRRSEGPPRLSVQAAVGFDHRFQPGELP